MELIKILAVTKEKSASHWHRLKYPLGKLQGVELEGREISVDFINTNEVKIELVNGYDILFYHWDIGLNFGELSQIKAKGTKVIYSIDDYWEFDINHPTYQHEFVAEYVKSRCKLHLMNADGVIVTTERLALHCLRFNQNVAILPNFLDVNDFNVERFEGEKLRVAIAGSISHFPDWMGLKGAIGRFAKNKAIAEGCEFHIFGRVSEDPYWEMAVNMFRKKRNLAVIVHDYVELDNYMAIYGHMDVCLMPLNHIEFNACKSALKLAECSIGGVIPVGSSLYSGKELKGIVVAETPLQYEQTIEKLLNPEFRAEMLEHTKSVNLKDMDFAGRLENTKAVIGAMITEDMSTKLDNVDIKTIIYTEDQVSEFPIYDNSGVRTLADKSWRFEYNPIINIVDNYEGRAEYLGIFSWKFPQKTNLTKEMLFKVLKTADYEQYDFISLSKRNWAKTSDFMDFTEKNHPEFSEKMEKVIKNLNFGELKYHPEMYTYSNFFLMRVDLWREYVNNWIKPSLEYMESNEEFMQDANYMGGLNAENLKKQTELDFYPWHTFILERLINYFIEYKGLKGIAI